MAQKAKKPRSEKQIAHAQKLAAAAKARAAEGKEKLEIINVPITPSIPEPLTELPEAPVTPEATIAALPVADKDAMILELMQKMMEMMEANKGNKIDKSAAVDEMAQLQGVRVTAQGGVQGQVFKYPVDKGFYADPTERLYDEPKLRRFALRDNYFFSWDVEGETYEKNGITYTEPRFTVAIYRHVFDEDGNETNKLALVTRNYLAEDEYMATIIANKLGFADKFESKEAMMDEVRYVRIRDWLLEVFTPINIKGKPKRATTMVIDGKAVEVFDTEVVLGEAAAEAKANAVSTSARL
jgi:hypothetical protein